MDHHLFRMDFESTLPYDSNSKNVALPINALQLSHLTQGEAKITPEGQLQMNREMYQDDILSVFEKSWRTRPGVSIPGHVDQDIHILMKALLMTFERAAWQKHGYSLHDAQDSLNHLKRGFENGAPTVEQVTNAYTKVYQELSVKTSNVSETFLPWCPDPTKPFVPIPCTTPF